MMLEYSFCFDEKHLVQSMDRYRSRISKKLPRLLLKAICIVGLSALLSVGVFAKIYPLAAMMIGLILLVLVGPRFDYWLLCRGFRKSPWYRNAVVVRLSDVGFFSDCESSRVEMPWTSITEVVRMRDGFLAFTGPRVFHWLPDAGLRSGVLGEAEAIFKAHVGAYSA